MPILSDDFVKRLSLGKRSELIVRDSKLTGFMLRVRRKADDTLSRSFFIVHELPPAEDGKRRRRKITIGEFGTYSAASAREEAEAMLRAVRKGDDPAAERAAKKAQPTFDELVKEYDEGHIAEKKKGTQADYRGRIRRHLLPEFGGRRVADISAQMVRELHRKRKAHPTDANRLLAVLSSMMSYAVALGWRETNPCLGIPRYKEKARDAWLDEHDLPPFIEALAKAEGPHATLVRFIAVTGWRVSEARTLRWDMVDLRRMVATLPDTKTGESVRALSTDAAMILSGQRHRTGFVFSKRGTMPLDYRHTLLTLADICKAAGIKKITPHVLRSTAATWAADAGASTHELREAFGWKSSAMADRYVKRAERLGRRGAQRAADAMNILQRPSADVVKPAFTKKLIG